MNSRVMTAAVGQEAIAWPRKCDVFGVQLSATNYEEAVDVILQAARRRYPAVVSLHAVHAVISAVQDPVLRRKVNTFAIVAPDGQPVRWAMNRLHHTGLRDRVYGPELMLRICDQAARTGVPIYLYGGSPEIQKPLCDRLRKRCPDLQIAGAEAPPFRQLSPEEDAEVVRRINQSGAGVVFIGLGCPKQDHFAFDHCPAIQAVQVCVGAAFDFHAGNKKMAPRWMQRSGMEWLFRLGSEPRRLWRRYLVTNTVFVVRFAAALVRRRRPQGTAEQ